MENPQEPCISVKGRVDRRGGRGAFRLCRETGGARRESGGARVEEQRAAGLEEQQLGEGARRKQACGWGRRVGGRHDTRR